MGIQIIGHRGNGRTTETPFSEGRAPQSTLLSFEQAIKQGADGVEFDVFLSRDQVPVVAEKPEVYGCRLSGYDYATIRKIPLSQGQYIPTLRETLIFLADLQARHPEGKELTFNLELKGEGVVENTVKVINEVVKSHSFNKNQIYYSTFDRQKLQLLRKLDPSANLQPTIATYQLFKPSQISMPGYHVDLKTRYNRAALSDLAKFIKLEGCSGIDIPTFDIRPELVEMADKLGVGLCTHPTGPRRKDDVGLFKGAVKLLNEFSKASGYVVFKVDDIQEARKLVAQNDNEKSFPLSRVERIMGMKLL